LGSEERKSWEIEGNIELGSKKGRSFRYEKVNGWEVKRLNRGKVKKVNS
jgi:hypothetical protein